MSVNKWFRVTRMNRNRFVLTMVVSASEKDAYCDTVLDADGREISWIYQIQGFPTLEDAEEANAGSEVLGQWR